VLVGGPPDEVAEAEPVGLLVAEVEAADIEADRDMALLMEAADMEAEAEATDIEAERDMALLMEAADMEAEAEADMEEAAVPDPPVKLNWPE